jgi:hypothetical protein
VNSQGLFFAFLSKIALDGSQGVIYLWRMTVHDFIEAIGGTKKAAVAFGVTAPAISNWKAREAIPWPHRAKASRLAIKLGLRFNPDRPKSRKENA